MEIYQLYFFKCKILLTLLTIFLHLPIYSQILLDTVKHKQVGPGMFYTKYVAHTIPWSIDVFEADMTNQYFAIETVKAFDLLAAGRKKTSSMSLRRNLVGHWSVSAVNGDFFDMTTGMPNNIQVENGQVLRKERIDYPTVGFNMNGEVSISKTYLTGEIALRDSSLIFNGINVSRDSNSLVFYNQFYGASTGTTTNGFEAIVNPLNSWFVNDTVYCTVDSISPVGKNTVIPDGSMVISASGTVANYLSSHVSVNDTVKILLNILPSVSKLKEMMGGHPIIIKKGMTASMNPNDAFVYNRHPRTAVGINEDTTKLFLVTVDGRQTSSLGMNLYELADLMLQIGVYQGINLDGGGSTTMVIRNEVVNTPSDASGERSVSNALLVVSKAPLDTLSFIDVSPNFSIIFIGKQIQFTIAGTYKYYNPIYVNPATLKYKLSDSTKGTITTSGLFTANLDSGECTVIASYGTIKDSAKIIIKGVDRLELTPDEAVTDKNRIVTFTAKVFDTDNIVQTIPLQNINWVCTDTTVGSINIVGQFQGKKIGIAKVIASYFSKPDTSTVKVEIGYGAVIIDSIETLSNWHLSGENVDTSLTKMSLVSLPTSLGSSSIMLDYSFTYQTSQYNWAYLNTNNTIYGVPDSIMIDVYSDGALHRIFFDAVDNENKLFRISSHKLANNPNIFETIGGRIVSSTAVYFPLTLKKISVDLGSAQVTGQTYSGTIYFDNLRVKYPQSAILIDDEVLEPSFFKLYQNYPNPFNPATTIKFTISCVGASRQGGTVPVLITVYDVLGNEVAKLIDEYKPAGSYEVEFPDVGTGYIPSLPSVVSAKGGYASGVYFYQLKAGNFISTKKMVLLR